MCLMVCFVSKIHKAHFGMKNTQKENFIALTKKEFQQYSESPITDEQAIEIQTNLFGFVNLLIEWDKNEQKSCKISNT